jgi:hypothetical protein
MSASEFFIIWKRKVEETRGFIAWSKWSAGKNLLPSYLATRLFGLLHFGGRTSRPLLTSMQEPFQNTGHVLRQIRFFLTGQIGQLKGNPRNVIAGKVGRINFHTHQLGRAFGQFQQTPIVSNLPSSTRFPSIHDFALFAKGQGIKDGIIVATQIVGRRKPFIRCKEHPSSLTGRTKIDHRTVLLLLLKKKG